MNDGKHVALAKCYFCGGPGEILLHKRLGDASKYHDKVISMTPCSTCEGHMKAGIIMMTVDDSKSESGWHAAAMPNPYRTGGFFVVREAFIQRTFQPESMVTSILKHRFTFIEHSAAEALGLFSQITTPPEQAVHDKDAK